MYGIFVSWLNFEQDIGLFSIKHTLIGQIFAVFANFAQIREIFEKTKFEKLNLREYDFF